jgi:hypothetical protein
MVEITYQMVLSTLQTVSLMVGVFYYIFIMRNSQKTRELSLKAQEQALETRQTQLLMQIYQELNSEETQKSWAELVNQEIIDYEDYIQKYDSSVNPNHYAKRVHIWYSFNTIGELLRQGLIDPDLLQRWLQGPWVIVMWEKWESIIRETRVRGRPNLWAGFEYLYNEMKRIRDSREYPEIKYPIPK